MVPTSVAVLSLPYAKVPILLGFPISPTQSRSTRPEPANPMSVLVRRVPVTSHLPMQAAELWEPWETVPRAGSWASSSASWRRWRPATWHNLACVVCEPVDDGHHHQPARSARDMFSAALGRSGSERSATEAFRAGLEQAVDRGL